MPEPDFIPTPRPAGPAAQTADSSGGIRGTLILMFVVLAVAAGLLWRLTRPESVDAVVFRLDPAVADADAERFEGIPVAEKRDVSGGETAAKLRRLLESESSYDARAAECPQFTLAVRVMRGQRPTEAVICLKCGRAVVFEAEDDGRNLTPRVFGKAALAELRRVFEELFPGKG